MASLYDLKAKSLFVVPLEDRTTTCRLCHLPAVPYEDRPEINCGPLYQYANPVTTDGRTDLEIYCAHYYCLLFSPGLETKGEDDEGIRGFMPADILREWRRGSRLKCNICDKKYATIGCCIGKQCRKTYHLPCGLKTGCHIEFREGFSSFCIDHRPVQNIFKNMGTELLEKVRECGVCLENLPRICDQNEEERRTTLHTPCCGGWFHKSCCERAAEVAGYFFKCPLCNNKPIFEEEMKKFGVYVPEQDAAWELEEGLFEDLLERHDTCNAEECICPEGRKKDEDYTIWEIILCKYCGAQGIHVECGNLELRDDIKWRCPGCVEVVKKLPPKIIHKFRPVRIKKCSRKRTLDLALKKTEIKFTENKISFNMMTSRKFSATFNQIKSYAVPMPVKLGPNTSESEKPDDSSVQQRSLEEENDHTSSKEVVSNDETSTKQVLSNNETSTKEIVSNDQTSTKEVVSNLKPPPGYNSRILLEFFSKPTVKPVQGAVKSRTKTATTLANPGELIELTEEQIQKMVEESLHEAGELRNMENNFQSRNNRNIFCQLDLTMNHTPPPPAVQTPKQTKGRKYSLSSKDGTAIGEQNKNGTQKRKRSPSCLSDKNSKKKSKAETNLGGGGGGDNNKIKVKLFANNSVGKKKIKLVDNDETPPATPACEKQAKSESKKTLKKVDQNQKTILHYFVTKPNL